MSSRNEVLDIYKKYISQGWYDNAISFTDIECWVDNFEKDSQNMQCDPLSCANLLLNALIFYPRKVRQGSLGSTSIKAGIVQVLDFLARKVITTPRGKRILNMQAICRR